ncbi:MAG: septal ring lytic transglycosylase RlpA family protein [Terriglobia bacterium]
MLKIVVGLGIAAFVAVSPPSQAGLPTWVPICARKLMPRNSTDGLASWYGMENQGNATASGEAFNVDAMTAAHPDLPMGTKIKVTNLSNLRSLVLRVNDRGPFIPGRLLDVSRAAASRLGFMRRGKAEVRIEVLRRSGDLPYRLACPGACLYAMY